ncbi:hypothetical protein ACLOJK_027598 [Asimina triloba]
MGAGRRHGCRDLDLGSPPWRMKMVEVGSRVRRRPPLLAFVEDDAARRLLSAWPRHLPTAVVGFSLPDLPGARRLHCLARISPDLAVEMGFQGSHGCPLSPPIVENGGDAKCVEDGGDLPLPMVPSAAAWICHRWVGLGKMEHRISVL